VFLALRCGGCQTIARNASDRTPASVCAPAALVRGKCALV